MKETREHTKKNKETSMAKTTNNATRIEPPPIKHTFTLEVEVPAWWPDYIAHCNDIFASIRIGYWAIAIDHDETRGWLAFEHGGDRHRPSDEVCARVARLWRRGEALPKYWMQIDTSVALRAWEQGVKRWGVDWHENGDASNEEVALQFALLGEERYA